MNYSLQILICLIIVPTCWTIRFSSRPQTLNIDPDFAALPKSNIRHIELPQDPIQLTQDDELLKLMDEYEKTHHASRSKRTIHSASPSNTKVRQNNFTIIEHHNYAIIAWSGKADSDTIVMVFRDYNLRNGSTSKVYVSYNYGKTYTNQTDHFVLSNGKYARVDYFIDSPDDYKKYVFVCGSNRAIFTSMDEANTFKRHDLHFTPTAVRTHPTDSNVLLARDETNSINRAYISRDFGKSWIMIYPNQPLEAIVFGANFDQNDTLYVQVFNSTTNTSNVYKTNLDLTTYSLFLSDVIEFDVASMYMFATRINNGDDTDIILLVSFDGGSFQRALFSSGGKNERSYYIADGSEGQLFVAVNHYSNLTNMYISGVRGVRFSLSLERVLYHDPKLSDVSTSWVYYSTADKLLDLHIVQGLRGIYIATQLTIGSVGHRYLRSFITYDKGGVWKRLTPPSVDFNNTEIICEPPCYLNLADKFASIYPSYYKSETIYSRKSAPGLIMASGSLGQNLYIFNNLMVSNTAGNTWLYALPFFHYYQIMDHGSLLVAGPKYYTPSNFIYYSLDEGVNWYRYVFYSSKVYIWGMYTEPGEKTSILTIYTSRVGFTEWLLFRVDFQYVLGSNCTKDQYFVWSPSEDIPDRDCLLGSLLYYERKLPSEVCYQGINYDRPTNSSICGCTREDFECDFGFGQEDSDAGCMPEDENPLYLIPNTCHPGQQYSRSRGYRLIAGDVCMDGDAKFFIPVTEPCPPVPSNITMTILEGKPRNDGLFEIKNGVSVTFMAQIFSINDSTMISDTYWSVGTGYEHYNTSQMTLTHAFSSPGAYRVVVKFYSKIYSAMYQTVVYVISSLTGMDKLFNLDLDMYTFIGVDTHVNLLVPNSLSDFGNLTYEWSFNNTYCKATRTNSLTTSFNSAGLVNVNVKISNSVSFIKLNGFLMVYTPVTINQLTAIYTGGNQVILTWGVASQTATINGYEILVRSGSNNLGFSPVYNLNQIKWRVINNLLASTQYSFEVRILSDHSFNTPSSPLSINTLDSSKVGQAPNNLKIARHSPNSLMASWEATSGSVSNNYALYIFSSSGVSLQNVNGLSYIYTYQMNDTYYFQVAAYAPDGSYQMALSTSVMYNTINGCCCTSSSTNTHTTTNIVSSQTVTPMHSTSNNNIPNNSTCSLVVSSVGNSGLLKTVTLTIILIMSILFNLIFLIVITSLIVTLYRVNKLRTQRYRILSHFNAEDDEVIMGPENVNFDQADNLVLEGTTAHVQMDKKLKDDANDDDEFILHDDKNDDIPLL